MRALVLFVILGLLWLGLSGLYYKPLIVGFGVFSCVLCVWIMSRLGLLSGEGPIKDFRPVAALRYLFWLTVEIGKADWAVTRAILSPELPRRQRLISVPCLQSTDLGRTLFANSITITPGTVTVETEGGEFIVHALTDEAADMDNLLAMGAKAASIEEAR